MSALGRAIGEPQGDKSNTTAAGTIGTTPTPTGNPRPRSSIHRMTPPAESSPNAEPPVRTMASTRSTRWRGESASSSRVPVARPSRAHPARNGMSMPRTTVTPVAPMSSDAWPTAMPSARRSAPTLFGGADLRQRKLDRAQGGGDLLVVQLPDRSQQVVSAHRAAHGGAAERRRERPVEGEKDERRLPHSLGGVKGGIGHDRVRPIVEIEALAQEQQLSAHVACFTPRFS